MHEDITSSVRRQFTRTRHDLEALVRIPSVSAPGFDGAHVRHSADLTAELMLTAGFDDVRLLEIEGAHPAVFGEIAAPQGAPTVLLYAHHDVQPPGPTSEWETPPFEPAERDGRIYGRGTSDDKAGIMVHLAAVRALGGQPPVGVKLFVEGEEEIGSLNLEAFLESYTELLASDVIVIADSGNWRVGTPALTTSLRGLVDCIVEVRTLEHAVHSGGFGGALPDAITCLARMIASLHDEDGEVAISGLESREADPLDLTEAELRSLAGAVPGVETIGAGSLTSRLWTKPAISVLALDVPPISEAINQLVPVARAKISMRIAPGQDPAAAMAALIEHIEQNVPWGAEVAVTPGASGEAFDLDATGSAYDSFRDAFAAAWGVDPVDIGVGGSIPFVAAFAKLYPEASILLTGVADPGSRAHGPNESLSLDELERGIVAEAIALRLLGS